MPIEAVPTWYGGTRFASTLEADWAATFDRLGWYWEYEPEAVKLHDGTIYRPDFRLPKQRAWFEVKGPHDERLEKTAVLQQTLYWEQEEWSWASWLVVVGRAPGPGEKAMWHGSIPGQDLVLIRCQHCYDYSFLDYRGSWLCRAVRHDPDAERAWYGKGDLYRPGELAFTRATRRQDGA